MPIVVDELLSMIVFARVVEAQSFTAAAPGLGLSKSVVSQRVSDLEKALGARLLHRTTRKLSLTPEGERLYERVRDLLVAADAATEVSNAVGNRIAGVLRVTAPVYLGLSRLTDWVSDFAQAHPEVTVELHLSDRMEDLVGSGFDLGIRVSPQLPDSSIVARRIGDEDRVPVAAPAYLAARGTPASPSELVGHACLRLAGVADEWWFASGDGIERIRVGGPLVSNSVSAIRLATLRGLGISILLRSLVADDLAAGRLVELALPCARPALGVYVVTAHHDVMPAKVRAFSDFLAARLAPKRARRR